MGEHTVPGHIVLVGMMGSGKTTVGRRVAKALGRPFVDADVALEERSGRTVADWFAEESEEAFRQAETDLLRDVLARTEPVVFASGGGVVLSSENRSLLDDPDHTVVWLRAGPKFLADRLASKPPKPHRPLLTGDIHERMATLDARRRDLYGQVADVIVDIEPAHRRGDRPKKELAAAVVEALSAHGVGPVPGAGSVDGDAIDRSEFQ